MQTDQVLELQAKAEELVNKIHELTGDPPISIEITFNRSQFRYFVIGLTPLLISNTARETEPGVIKSGCVTYRHANYSMGVIT